MTMVLNLRAAGAGTHALVIGVGEYPYLMDGTGRPTFPRHDNMGQLSSPPESARALATWLLSRYNNPAKPLRSLDLLISDSLSSKFTKPDGPTVAVERATFGNLKRAIHALSQRASGDPADLLVFFFSGHGISAGPQTTLLPENFGEPPQADLTQAIDFNGLYLGLDRCGAREQCFFIDACRVATRALFETYQYYGDPIIHGLARHAATPRHAPVYHATLPGKGAYGLQGQPSFFTQALLWAFNGAGSDDRDGSGAWRVQSDSLLLGLHHLLRRQVDRSAASGQFVDADHLSRFSLHHLGSLPVVPVEVTCVPEGRNANAILVASGSAGQLQRDPPKIEPWDLDLVHGHYTFIAQIPEASGGPWQEQTHVYPPFCLVRIQVP